MAGYSQILGVCTASVKKKKRVTTEGPEFSRVR